ncbi:MAG: translation elongation factor Ts [Paludibacteraceae bacterium]|nr:translation elongation factor Ts [Paludibacteraceae bacterium]
MANVTVADIAKLRKMTGAGMMDCKNALAEAECDFDKAIELIRKRGQAIAAKRSDREAAEGCVLAANEGGFAALVGVKCETDFVAKNADFIALTKKILDAAMAAKPANLEALKNVKIGDRTVAELITAQSGVTGEKMELGAYEFVEGPATTSYIHNGNKLASIVAFNENAVEKVLHEVAMQVAAMNPISISRDDVPEDIKAKELEIGREKAREEGKPEAILDRIAQGRLNKFFQESTLLEQEFIMDAKKSVKQHLEEASKTLTATAFKRFTLNQE